MEYCLKNDRLTLRVSSRGAEMQSILGADGTEYLWQGDERYWKDRATNIFPYVARLTNETYRWQGQEYHMKIHGFARHSEFTPAEQTDSRLVLEITDSRETREQYPFSFVFQVIYQLEGSRISLTYRVENRGEGVMPFGLGAHPGFNVPLRAGLDFSDYSLTFTRPCAPVAVGMSPTCFVTGEDLPYPLEAGQRIPLRHNLFDNDAIVLKGMDRQITLATPKDPRGVRVTYPDMPVLGIWHAPKTEAPYVCIEPWLSLPSRQDVVEDFAAQPDLMQLEGGKTYENTIEIELLA